MRDEIIITAAKKSRFYSTLTVDNITIVRFLFYILSAAILIKIGMQRDYFELTNDFGMINTILYFFMGIVAATIANSTGAGGGIVFLPVFIGLGFSPAESLATSITIQCFGMSSGALTWISFHNKEKILYPKQWKYFYFILTVSALSSCLGVLITQRWMTQPPLDIELLFSLFSLFIGSIFLHRTLRLTKESHGRIHGFSISEVAGLIIVCFVGGIITRWLSIGVGEILLIYLIFLGIRTNVAIASAVCLSVVSVLTVLPYHISSDTISYDVLVYAAPGALIGGVIARSLATHLGAHRLKIAASSWIIISAIPLLVIGLI